RPGGLRRAGAARCAEAPNVFVQRSRVQPMATYAAGRARPPEASRRLLNLQADLPNQRFEPRLRPQRGEGWVDVQPDQRLRAFRVSLLEPPQRLARVAEARVHAGEEERQRVVGPAL